MSLFLVIFLIRKSDLNLRFAPQVGVVFLERGQCHASARLINVFMAIGWGLGGFGVFFRGIPLLQYQQ